LKCSRKNKARGFNIWFFDKVIVFTENDLPHSFKEFCENNKNVDRGYGYYIWKPYIVNLVANMSELSNCIIWYLDAGCWINKFGLNIYKRYLSAISDAKPFICFERIDYIELQCVKRDVFVKLNALEYARTHPIMAGVFGFKLNFMPHTIISEWCNQSFNNPELLTQLPSVSGAEFSEYEVNRNDQGLFSLIVKKNKCYNSFSAEHILPELHNSYLEMYKYPFYRYATKVTGFLKH